MANSLNLTRKQLAEFLPDPKTIKQFEKLLGLIQSLDPEVLNTLTMLASSAQASAMTAHNSLALDYIDVRTGPHVTQPGRIAWNEADGTIDIGMGYDGVVQQVGLETYYRIKASASITNGQLVMFDGSVGASGVLKGKPATGLTSGQLVMGVATMDIANNSFGYVTAFGLVRGINTTGASVGETWADGDLLYYNSAYAGGLTNVAPTAPTPKVICAAVVNAGSGGSGSLFVRSTFMPRLADLSDVQAASPTAGQTLLYDATQTRWEAASITAGANITITPSDGGLTIAAAGVSGATGTFTTVDGKTVTVTNGIITSIV